MFKILFKILLITITFALSSCFSSRKAPSTDYRRIKKDDSRNNSSEKETKKEAKKEKSTYDFNKYSSKLGIELTGRENSTLIEEISRWMGTPYKTGGCSLEGTDCSCLIHNLYEKVYGINLERSSEAMAQKNCQQIDKEELQEGDLIFFSIKNVKISHVGLFISNGNFVHSTTSKGVIISNLNESYYQKYYTHSGRVQK